MMECLDREHGLKVHICRLMVDYCLEEVVLEQVPWPIEGADGCDW